MTTDICFGNWHTCPNVIGISICTKKRNCSIEISCMREWLKINDKNN